MTRLVNLEDREEGFLRDLHGPHLLHSLLPLLLLLEELAFARDVATVTLSRHVLAERANRLARDHLGADRGLDQDVEQLAREPALELLGDRPAPLERLVAMAGARERIP